MCAMHKRAGRGGNLDHALTKPDLQESDMANTDTTTAQQQKIDRLTQVLIKKTRGRFDAWMSYQRSFTDFERVCLNVAYDALHAEDEGAIWDSFDAWSALKPSDDCTEREFAIWAMADSCIETSLSAG